MDSETVDIVPPVIQRLRIEPDEVLVIKGARLNKHSQDQLRRELSEALPGVRVMLLPENAELAVVSRGESLKFVTPRTHGLGRVYDAHGTEWKRMMWVNQETGDGEQRDEKSMVCRMVKLATPVKFVPHGVEVNCDEANEQPISEHDRMMEFFKRENG